MSRISRRRFCFHAAHTSVGAAGLAALGAMEGLAAEPAQKPVTVCLVSGSLEYKSDQSLARLQEHWEKTPPRSFRGAKGDEAPVRCTRAFIRSESDLPGLEKLDTADCMVLFTRRLNLPDEQLEHVRRYCRRGGPIVALRTASHAFQTWLALDKEVLGGDYRGHYGNQFKTEVRVVAAAKDHPILAGFRPFVSDGSLYKNPQLAADAQVLLDGAIPGHVEPIAWTRTHRGGRVFYTSLGHPNDFADDSFLRLLTNALLWATARPDLGRRFP